jgi:hypothetical protein
MQDEEERIDVSPVGRCSGEDHRRQVSCFDTPARLGCNTLELGSPAQGIERRCEQQGYAPEVTVIQRVGRRPLGTIQVAGGDQVDRALIPLPVRPLDGHRTYTIDR